MDLAGGYHIDFSEMSPTSVPKRPSPAGLHEAGPDFG